jgi:hypothetical protein
MRLREAQAKYLLYVAAGICSNQFDLLRGYRRSLMSATVAK